MNVAGRRNGKPFHLDRPIHETSAPGAPPHRSDPAARCRPGRITGQPLPRPRRHPCRCPHPLAARDRIACPRGFVCIYPDINFKGRPYVQRPVDGSVRHLPVRARTRDPLRLVRDDAKRLERMPILAGGNGMSCAGPAPNGAARGLVRVQGLQEGSDFRGVRHWSGPHGGGSHYGRGCHCGRGLLGPGAEFQL
ncbi:peptidase inhibitor family I36 protein [Streptomyces griseoluteus]|uniref:peptidase inhibitor family I36 protein n=1 Tax=Streptomyces griseoluteus TaxID=29306 RepID=UPI0033D0AC14